MKSSTELRLLQEMLVNLGLKNCVWERDYWVLGPIGLGLGPALAQQGHQVLRMIILRTDFHWQSTLVASGLKVSAHYFADVGEMGFEFHYKDFQFQVLQTQLPPAEIAEIRLHQALKTLIEIHGSELTQVLKRYLSYDLSLERAISEYFGLGPDWRERLMSLANPTSAEAVLRALG